MHKVTLMTGMQRDGMNSTSRTFFVFVAPTGAEVPLKECSGMKRAWSRGGNPGRDQGVDTTTEYDVREPVRIKMVAIYTAFGKRKEFGNIYLDIDENFELIEITGLNSFGGFRGRARIEKRLSNITDDQLKERYHYMVIAPPINTSTVRPGNCRSLVL